MSASFDRRVVPANRVALILSIQQRAECRLAGGAALSGLHLAHRLSNDVDLFFPDQPTLRDIVRLLPDVARENGVQLRVVRDGGTHVRAEATDASTSYEIDLVYDPAVPLESPERTAENVVVDSFVDLRAAKVACLLERAEPRDLVDCLFLERAGFPAEGDLGSAARKDAGVDPATLAWLLHTFPTTPLPAMLLPLAAAEVVAYRDALAERFRRMATP